jgi:hypothetical protein
VEERFIFYSIEKRKGVAFSVLMVVWLAFFCSAENHEWDISYYSIINRMPSALWLAFKGSYLFFLRSSFYLAGAPLCKLIKAAYYHLFLKPSV